jgi:uncharacterized protein
MNDPGYFELQADDPARAATFYRTVFGWDITKDEAMPIEYWRVDTRGGIDGAILERPAGAPPERSGTNAAVISLQVESFDATADAIKRNGGIVAMPKFAVAGRCWQGYFVDPAGNTFGIFQVDPNPR